jgi:hypothetical protein
MKYYDLFILLGIILQINTQQTSLEISLESKEDLCLSEYYKEGIANVISIYSDSDCQMDIYEPDGDSLYTNSSQIHQFSFISEKDGYYDFCIVNDNDFNISYTFILKTGIAARDYSSLAKTRDLKPSEIELEKINDRKKNIEHFAHSSDRHQRRFERRIERLTSKIITCSLIIMGVMIIIGGVETFYLKKFMERRKII